ncbi:MAG: pyridoxamine 5-phosphate oxidase, partial [Proteobacteria bacterium]
MTRKFLELAVTPNVLAVQAAMGHESRLRPLDTPLEADRLTESEVAFLESRDSFYLATVSETGWPYV